MRTILFIALLVIIRHELSAQPTEFLFQTARERDGLSSNACVSLLKDSRGLMWIGTQNGLNRYDGSHFNVFNARQNNSDFINNTIVDLCEDKNGNIWGATGSGIFSYDVNKNKFRNYIPPGYDYARAVHNILCDKEGNIWATGLWTILKLNKAKGQFEEIGPLTRVKDSLNFYSVRYNGLVLDPSGNGLWMATKLGLHYYDIKANRFTSYKTEIENPLFAPHSITCISWSRFGYFWFFDNTTKEIVSFNPNTRTILSRISTEKTLPNAIGQTVFEDSQHNLWFSSWSNKMAIIDYRNNKVTTLNYKTDNPLSVPGENFKDIIEDKDHNIWIASVGGLSVCNYTRNIYNTYPISDNVKQFAEGNLGFFTEDPRDHSWWIASDANASIIHYNPTTTEYTFYDFSKARKNKLEQLPSFVVDIQFINNNPVIFTQTGIWQIDENTKQIRNYNVSFKGYPNILPLYLKEYGNYIWYSSAEGMVKLDKRTNNARLIKAKEPVLADSQHIVYNAFTLDQKGQPWFIPAFGWLAHVNEKDELVLNYYIKDKPKELASWITNMNFDGKGNLWMSSIAAGMYRYNLRDKTMKLFDQIEGPGTNTAAFTIDNSGKFWIASSSNIYVYAPESGSVSGFSLPFFEYTNSFTSRLKMLSDNSILVSFHKYLVRFFPDRLNHKPFLSKPILSMINIAGKNRFLNDEKQLKLEPEENSLEFSFGSLINKAVFPYSFEYQLVGFDRNWKKANSNDKAIFNNLKSGDYTFRIRAVSKNKNWTSPERVLNITIRTPFYRATWFWILVGAIVLASIYLFYSFRLQKQKQIHTLESKAQELEKEKTVVMYESLKQQLNPHFLFNSLTSLSGLIETNQELAGDFLEQLSGMYRYMLKNRDSETVLLKNEIEFVRLYISLQQTRFKNGLIVNINIPDDYLHYKIAPVTLQNLIENAIKHNVIDQNTPLIIDIAVADNYIIVKNNLQKKSVVETSNKKGLEQFTTLYSYLSEMPVVIEETDKEFWVKIPLI